MFHESIFLKKDEKIENVLVKTQNNVSLLLLNNICGKSKDIMWDDCTAKKNLFNPTMSWELGSCFFCGTSFIYKMDLRKKSQRNWIFKSCTFPLEKNSFSWAKLFGNDLHISTLPLCILFFTIFGIKNQPSN